MALIAACGKKVQHPASPVTSEPSSQGGGSVASAEKSLDVEPNERHEYLEIIVHNSNAGDIDETEVTFGKRSCTFGIVGTGVSAGYLGWTLPVGTKCLGSLA